MSIISWDEKYSVGNREIDSQHKTIIRLINELNDNDCESKRAGVTERVLLELVKYIAYHFSFEEKLMVQYGCSDTKEHMSKHNYLIEELKKFMVGNGNKSSLPAKELKIFLSDWLNSHIMSADKNYSTLLRDYN